MGLECTGLSDPSHPAPAVCVFEGSHWSHDGNGAWPGPVEAWSDPLDDVGCQETEAGTLVSI